MLLDDGYIAMITNTLQYCYKTICQHVNKLYFSKAVDLRSEYYFHELTLSRNLSEKIIF